MDYQNPAKTDSEDLATNTETRSPEESFGIVLRADAGTILKKNISNSLENACKEKLEEAIKNG